MDAKDERRTEQLKMLGLNIARIREEKNVSQRELSLMLGHAGHAHLSRVEGGKKAPSIATILEMADALDVSARDFFEGV